MCQSKQNNVLCFILLFIFSLYFFKINSYCATTVSCCCVNCSMYFMQRWARDNNRGIKEDRTGTVARCGKQITYVCAANSANSPCTLHVTIRRKQRKSNLDNKITMWHIIDWEHIDFCDTHARIVIDANGQKATAPCSCSYSMTQVHTYTTLMTSLCML